MKSKFNIESPNKKLKNWHELEFNEFLRQISTHSNKGQLPLATGTSRGLSVCIIISGIAVSPIATLSEQAQWMEYFNEQKQKALAIKTEIDQTDKEIDAMVYELYGLTEEEIKIVEGG